MTWFITSEAHYEVIEELEKQNAALVAAKNKPLHCKVSDKGALSVYCLQRFPVTLYRQQWERLITFVPEMQAFIEKHTGELTTKELRLMELARALAGQPRILLLDETLAGLGAAESTEVVNLLRTLAEGGITIVIIEHTMHAMVKLVDRFLVLDHGTVLIEDLPEAITRNAQVIEA